MFGSRQKQKLQVAGIDQDELVDPSVLADPDSCFLEFNGVRVHHKVCDAGQPNASQEGIDSLSHSHQSKRTNFPMVLLHGFGASVFSWDRAMKPLAKISCSKVLAFDRPAFGLTSRPNPVDNRALNPYSTTFSVLATLHFIDSLAADKAVLVGHSAGCVVAVEAYFEAPERVAALILVAPAIVASFTSRKVNQSAGKSQTDKRNPESSSSPCKKWNVFGKILSILSNFAKQVAQILTGIVKGMGEMLNSLYRKALASFLRSAIGLVLMRMVISKFGTAAVRNSWYDPKQVTEHVLQGYTKPLRVKGWDRALVEHTVAMLTESKLGSKPPLSQRLSEIACPVLIVTGDKDRLVPAWNSERLSRAITGSCYEVIKNSGHLPHEERVEEFVSIVDMFFQKVFGEVQEPHLQVVS
ncbi:unnamed protein product [Cuscuta campestris]|uniref:AB hydrolase-1 domain-containing protein n=1 Tax=Cuscuta campestris TaxID=132261 RepID=A0A484LW98_9ASTE|nr:unnamed protein product [Cuscuta campestris]